MHDFDTSHLNEEQKRIADVILHVCREICGPDADGGGCTAFYTPEDWQARGEIHGLGSVLLVVHDGGSLNYFFNLDHQCYEMYEKMFDALDEIGYWAEPCLNWYTAIYPSSR